MLAVDNRKWPAIPTFELGYFQPYDGLLDDDLLGTRRRHRCVYYIVAVSRCQTYGGTGSNTASYSSKSIYSISIKETSNLSKWRYQNIAVIDDIYKHRDLERVVNKSW